MTVIGIGGLMDDAACALAQEGRILAAVEQKKIARRHTPGMLPIEAIEETLRIAAIDATKVNVVAMVRPLAASPDSLISLRVRQVFANARLLVVDHHTAHAASTFYASGFEEATVLVVDRAGDLRCSSRWTATRTGPLTLHRESYFPDSIGDLYGRVTEFLGFRSRADEHKVQWLSASGDDRYVELFENILGAKDSGWPSLDRAYFDRDRLNAGGFSQAFYTALDLADGAAPPPNLHAHLARGLQTAVENCVLAMAGEGNNLCVAGGVFFNALLVRWLEASGRFNRVYSQAAAGNAGTAIGAAYLGSEQRAALPSLALGPAFQSAEIKQVLENCKLSPKFLLTTDELIQSALSELREHRIIAWFQDRMEFGPRALGNRSILASPLDPYATENLNSFIKHREAFRKFAASVPRELAGRYFEFGDNATTIASVASVRPEFRQQLGPALLGSELIRLHVVDREENPLFHRLLTATGEQTGLPILYNTSFNLFGDALVCTPRDAVRSFYSSGIDAMYVGPFLLRK
jgi:carbamoyltransferase